MAVYTESLTVPGLVVDVSGVDDPGTELRGLRGGPGQAQAGEFEVGRGAGTGVGSESRPCDFCSVEIERGVEGLQAARGFIRLGRAPGREGRISASTARARGGGGARRPELTPTARAAHLRSTTARWKVRTGVFRRIR